MVQVLCHHHTRGPKCALCEAGYVAGVTDGSTLGCERCSTASTLTRVAWVVGIVGVVFAAGAVLYWNRVAFSAYAFSACRRIHAIFVASKGTKAGIFDVEMNDGENTSLGQRPAATTILENS